MAYKSKQEFANATGKEWKLQVVVESWQDEGTLRMGSYLPTEGVQVNIIHRWSEVFCSSTSPASDRDSKSPVEETTRAAQKGTTQLHGNIRAQTTATTFVCT